MWSRPTAWWWVIVPPAAISASEARVLMSRHCPISRADVEGVIDRRAVRINIGEAGRDGSGISRRLVQRLEVEAHGANVHLLLRVKVRENWLDDPERYRAVGLEFTKG